MSLIIPVRETEETEQEDRSSASEGSTWRGLWRKTALLLPYLWPSKSFGLKIKFFVCVILLVSVRVTNVYVPVYYKEVVNRLSEASASGWPWDCVLIWLSLKILQGGGTGTMNSSKKVRLDISRLTSRKVSKGLRGSSDISDLTQSEKFKRPQGVLRYI